MLWLSENLWCLGKACKNPQGGRSRWCEWQKDKKAEGGIGLSDCMIWRKGKQMTTRIFLRVREVCLDVFVRRWDMCVQLGMCVQDTPILCRAHAYTGSGIIYKGSVEGIGGGGAAPQPELVEKQEGPKDSQLWWAGEQPSYWAGVSTLAFDLLAFSWFLIWEWQLFGKGSKATKSDCLHGYEGFPRQEQDKENLWVEGQESQPDWVEQVGKGILVFHWDQEGEKSRWFPCFLGSGCSRNLYWSKCCRDDWAT